MHPEADAFLDAIFDHPDDDTPRLVYADWLQEHGQEDYAQFIRLSIQMDNAGSSKERKQLDSQRKPFWNRMRVVRQDAIAGVRIYDYGRGVLNRLTTYGDSLVRTIDLWWPAMTPPSLVVDGARGFYVQSIESELVTTIGNNLPWLRELTLISTRRSTQNVDDPFDGTLFAALAKPDALPRLRSLHVTVTRVDVPALRAFAESDLASRLESLAVEVRSPQTDEYGITTVIPIYENHDPNAIRLAIEEFLERNE